MKATSRLDRIFQSLPGIVTAIGLCCCGTPAQARSNAWTSSVSGNWEDPTWSLGVRPGTGQDVFITNANWKAVQLTHSTALNFPESLTVNSITLAAPPDTINTLLLNNVGISSPLDAGSIMCATNTVITMLASALESSGTFSVNGTVKQGSFSGVTASNLDIGSNGVYNLTNGTLSVIVGQELLGVAGLPLSPPSTFNQEGGFHDASHLSILPSGGYHLHGGQLGGEVQIAGGRLEQTGGDFSPARLSLVEGSLLPASLVQSGGTGTIGPTTVGDMSSVPNPPSEYTLLNGAPVFSSDLTIGSLGIFDEEGGSNTVRGALTIASDVSQPDHPALGKFRLAGGALSAHDISVSGVYSQTGGTNRVAGDFTLTGVYGNQCDLSDGLLMTSNTYMGAGGTGNFIQTGGRHQISGTLRVSGTSEPAYRLNGGELIAPTIRITAGATFRHDAGVVTNSDLLQLDGGWWDEYAGEQKFGQLQISASGGSLWFGTNSAILRFADSSGQSWGLGILHVRNWSGSLDGGGNQLIFGSNSSGLTPAQVSRIRFDFPDSEYTAKILGTGEVVPDESGVPLAPGNLVAEGVSDNQINLMWMDNPLNETGFKIERGTDGSNFVQIATVTTNTSYADTGLTPMTTCFYRVRAYNDAGDSGYSSVAEASTKWSGSPPLSGMVAWWPGENCADDVIGSHNGATPYGIGYARGESGQAFDFDASNRRVFVPDNPDFVPTNGFTFEGWFYARQTLDAYIGMRGDDRGGMDSWAVRRLSNGNLNFQIDDALNNSAAIESPVQDNHWYHFAATFDKASGSIKLYLNGAIAAQTNTTLQPIGVYDPGWNSGIGIGNQSGTITHTSFDGLIDDVAVYSRALSPSEIQSIYTAGSGGKASLAETKTNSPPLLSLQAETNGITRLVISGLAGRNYEVQTSTDLWHWTSWTQASSIGTNSIEDSTNPLRFYRVRLLK